MLNLLFNRSLNAFTGCAHDLFPGSTILRSTSVSGNTDMGQSMLGTYSPGNGLVIQYTHYSTLWVGHTSPSDFTQYASPSHSIRITPFLVLIPIPAKAYYYDIPTVLITNTDLSGSQDLCMFPIILCLVVPPIKLTSGIITTGTGSSASILSFVNIITVWWSDISFTIAERDAKANYVMNYPCHCPSTILWLCCIVTACHTPTKSFLSGDILRIGTEIIQLTICVPHEVHYHLIQRIVSIHCNLTVMLILIPTSTF